MPAIEVITEPQEVVITRGRWDVHLAITTKTGTIEKLVISADSALRESAIFVGSPAEANEKLGYKAYNE